jgi:hypothetical protein
MFVGVIPRLDTIQTCVQKGLDYVLNMSPKIMRKVAMALMVYSFFAAKHPRRSLCFISYKNCASCKSSHLRPIYLTRVGSDKSVKFSVSEALEE